MAALVTFLTSMIVCPFCGGVASWLSMSKDGPAGACRGSGCSILYGGIFLLSPQPALQSGDEIMNGNVLLLLLLLFLRSGLALQTCGPQPYPKVEGEA